MIDFYNGRDFVRQLENEGFDARGTLVDSHFGVLVGPKGIDPARGPVKGNSASSIPFGS